MSKWIELCDEVGVELQSTYSRYDEGGLRYPSFTAEKQLEVIEFLSEFDFNSWSYRLTEDGDLEWKLTLEDSLAEGSGSDYSEALSDLLKKLYPKLLEAKQQALKGILEK